MWVGLNALQPGGAHQHADRLGLTLYSQGKLPVLEKASPYNEMTTRELATLSPMHNTVTVDMTSQKQGEQLAGPEIPAVAVFHSGLLLHFARLDGDRLYPQTRVYRRSVVVLEDIVLDFFEVEGGSTHDWMLHHAGPSPTLSIASVAVDRESFHPAEWLYNGTDRLRHGITDADWTAQWMVDGVAARLTMAAAPETRVYLLQTYPVDNAVITAEHPPCETLCVRRANDAPCLAVWDAWTGTANLQSVRRAGAGNQLAIKTANNIYHATFGPGAFEFDDGVRMTTDAVFAVLRNRDAAAFAGGATLDVAADGAVLRVRLSEPGCAEATQAGERSCSPPIQYDTFGGENHLRLSSAIQMNVEGDWFLPAR